MCDPAGDPGGQPAAADSNQPLLTELEQLGRLATEIHDHPTAPRCETSIIHAPGEPPRLHIATHLLEMDVYASGDGSYWAGRWRIGPVADAENAGRTVLGILAAFPDDG